MEALSAGLGALEEAEQIRRASCAVADVDLSLLVETHSTPVLYGEDLSELVPLAAMDRYHEYAEQQLGMAVAGDPSGSMALYGLARIYEHLGSENNADRVASSRQSVALHKAALLAHPENHLAAHELGVVLTRLGMRQQALAMLTRSVQLYPTSRGYQNLALMHRQIGGHSQAAVAEQYAAQMAQREQTSGAEPTQVTWLDPGAFARTSERGEVASVVSTEPSVGARLPSQAHSQHPWQHPARR
jgi:tetratricopeptide (TPR) repeat protein